MSNGFLFKWESNNRGLDHKCGTCKTVLSSPRAKKTCFGVHEEVCSKYHKTLFYQGNAHKCEACRKSRVQHDKRHRDIASLVQSISDLNDFRAGTSPSLNKTRKARKDDGLEFFKLETGFAGESGEPEDWPDTSTVCDDDVDGQISGLAERKENVDFKKIPKAERKTVKPRCRFQVITAEELERIQDALHPARDPSFKKGARYLERNSLTNNATIDKNIAFNSHTFQYSSLRATVQQQKLERNGGVISKPHSRTPLDESQMSAIFHRLGISTSAASNSTKERRFLLIRLRGAIEKDLLCVENEDRETMARMAGYWRYVNRRTYNVMVRNNELWDWATGAKLEEIEEEEEEENELDSANDADDQPSPKFSESDTFIGTPQLENWDDDFIFDSDDPLHLASNPVGGFEQRDAQMFETPSSVVAQEVPVSATPVKTAAMVTVERGDASPWAGIKDTRRLPRRSTSPPSPRKRPLPRAKSPPVMRLSLKDNNSQRSRKYAPLRASTTAPSARTRKSLSMRLADFHLTQLPKGKPSSRRPDFATKPNSTAAKPSKKPPGKTPRAVKPVSVNQVPNDWEDDDTIGVPAATVYAPEAAPFRDPNNRFSLLM